MNNFEFRTPTRVSFGLGSIARLPELLSRQDKIMLIYGSGSIIKNGVYAQITEALQEFDYVEFGGIEPNPRYETCMQAVELARRENVTFLLAAGGGSVLDGTKFIAAALKFDGEPWDILAKGAEINAAVPLGDVITLPATGSEMNGNAVISRNSTGEKLPFHSELVIPKFSIIDPQVTESLPRRQTTNGIVDTYVHVMEQFATRDVNTPVQDLSAIAIVRTLLAEAPKVFADPNDYAVRANIFWCATLGLNTWISQGVVEDWSTHMIGHELTAFFGIDHGQSLAIVLPELWKYKFEAKKQKLALLAREAWKVEGSNDETARAAIVKTVEFFHSIGAKTKLADYGIQAKQAAELVRERFNQRNAHFGEDGDIDGEAAFKILSGC